MPQLEAPLNFRMATGIGLVNGVAVCLPVPSLTSAYMPKKWQRAHLSAIHALLCWGWQRGSGVEAGLIMRFPLAGWGVIDLMHQSLKVHGGPE